MKNYRSNLLLLLIFLIGLVFTAPACRAKYGCKINEETHTDLSKRKAKKSKQQLFPKKMRRN